MDEHVEPVNPPSAKNRLPTVAVLLLVIGFLLFLMVPPVVRAKKSADLTMATSSLRNLGIFLYEFEREWGTFPSEEILRENPDRFPGVRPGDSANALLSMLVAGGYLRGEFLFHENRSGETDDVITPPERLLEPGECVFGYVMLKGGRAMTDKDNGGRPIIVAKLERGQSGADPRFTANPYNGRAVYLRIDQSVKQNQIDDDGRVLLPGGITLFERGPDTVWGDDVPDVRAPEW